MANAGKRDIAIIKDDGILVWSKVLLDKYYELRSHLFWGSQGIILQMMNANLQVLSKEGALVRTINLEDELGTEVHLFPVPVPSGDLYVFGTHEDLTDDFVPSPVFMRIGKDGAVISKFTYPEGWGFASAAIACGPGLICMVPNQIAPPWPIPRGLPCN
jgi:hypothetical protein